MIHAVIGKASSGGGTTSSASVSFNPPGGTYTGTSKTITVTVAGTGVTKLRWKLDAGDYTTINALSVILSISLSVAGHTLTVDALNANDAVLATRSDLYTRDTG